MTLLVQGDWVMQRTAVEALQGWAESVDMRLAGFQHMATVRLSSARSKATGAGERAAGTPSFLIGSSSVLAASWACTQAVTAEGQ